MKPVELGVVCQELRGAGDEPRAKIPSFRKGLLAENASDPRNEPHWPERFA